MDQELECLLNSLVDGNITNAATFEKIRGRAWNASETLRKQASQIDHLLKKAELAFCKNYAPVPES